MASPIGFISRPDVLAVTLFQRNQLGTVGVHRSLKVAACYFVFHNLPLICIFRNHVSQL